MSASLIGRVLNALDDYNVEFFVGPPRREFKSFGKEIEYLTFINGEIVAEGETAKFVSADIENVEEKLAEITARSIARKATSENCKAIVFRDGCENGEFRTIPADVSDFTGSVVYSPARVAYRTRVAFVV